MIEFHEDLCTFTERGYALDPDSDDGGSFQAYLSPTESEAISERFEGWVTS